MSARTLSQLLFAAEVAPSDEKNAVVVAGHAGLVLDSRLLPLLDHLIDHERNLTNFATVCQAVHENKQLPVFWRSLAAHHHGLVSVSQTQSDEHWKEGREARLARAMGIMATMDWTVPGSRYELAPEYLYIYCLNALAMLPSLGRADRQAEVLGMSARTAILAGWFVAPAWADLACQSLSNAGNSSAKQLMQDFAARRIQAYCYFSRLQSAKLMSNYGNLLAV